MMMMMLILQLEMHQPLYNEQQLQQQQQRQSTTVMQTTGAAQPVVYVVPSAYTVCENYASRQSKIAGIILIIAGALSIVFNLLGMFFFLEFIARYGHGIWCGAMVSSCVLLFDSDNFWAVFRAM